MESDHTFLWRRPSHPERHPRHPRALAMQANSEAAVVASTDALEFLLEETELDPRITAQHLLPLSGDVYYCFGTSLAMTGWSLRVFEDQKRSRLEGVYLSPQEIDGLSLPPSLRRQFKIFPSPCEIWKMTVIERFDDEAVRIVSVEVITQDKNESIEQLLVRTLAANTGATQILGAERLESLLRHLCKFWLYISGNPKHYFTAAPAPRPPGFLLANTRLKVPSILFGPTELEPQLSPKFMHDGAIATWKKGLMSTLSLPEAHRFVLKWEEPHLARSSFPPQAVLKV